MESWIVSFILVPVNIIPVFLVISPQLVKELYSFCQAPLSLCKHMCLEGGWKSLVYSGYETKSLPYKNVYLNPIARVMNK